MNPLSKKSYLFDIPEQFYSVTSNAPFTTCLSCNKSLLVNDTEYVIEKAIKQYKDFNTTDTIFEYAVCLECHDKFLSSYSEESLSKIRDYFLQNSDNAAKRRYLYTRLEEGAFDIDEWLSSCLIKGTPVSMLNEYQMGCQCIGTKMIVQEMPFIIGNEAMDEIMMLLSNQTIGEMNRFIDEFLGLPPDLKKLLKDSGIVIF